MRELRSLGSVRGVSSNGHPYRDRIGIVRQCGRIRTRQRARSCNATLDTHLRISTIIALLGSKLTQSAIRCVNKTRPDLKNPQTSVVWFSIR